MNPLSASIPRVLTLRNLQLQRALLVIVSAMLPHRIRRLLLVYGLQVVKIVKVRLVFVLEIGLYVVL
jgi:hypothetical protein